MSHAPLQALIDAGTNTFKLVIFRRDADPLSAIVFEEEVFVKLWEPEAGQIAAEKADRAIDVLNSLKRKALQHDAGNPALFCTEAFRTSGNGPALLHRIHRETGLQPKMLTGREEAQLLARAALHLTTGIFTETITTMDIGGGSSEIAIIDPVANKVLLTESLPLGGSAIYNRLQISDPLRKADMERISDHVRQHTLQIQNQVLTNKAFTLLGSAGVFESLVTLKHYPKLLPAIAPEGWAEIEMPYLEEMMQKAMQTTAAERATWKGLKPSRAPYITAAFVMLHAFVEMAGITRILYSRAGLKEGLVLASGRQL